MALKRWGIASFTVATDATLLEAQTGEETVIFSLLLSNYGAAAADITVRHTGTDGTATLFQWVLTKAVGESPTALQAPIVLEPGDKIIIQSDLADVAVLASGEAK